MKNLTLHTNRLVLRPVEINDYNALLKVVTDVDSVGKIKGFPIDSNELKNMLDEYETEWLYGCNDQQTFAFAVLYNKLVIGMVCIYLNFIDAEMNEAELGYMLNKKYWNRGLGKEAVIKVIEYSVNCLNVKRIIGKTDSTNLNSCCLMEKLGMYKVDEWIEKDEDENGSGVSRSVVKYILEI